MKFLRLFMIMAACIVLLQLSNCTAHVALTDANKSDTILVLGGSGFITSPRAWMIKGDEAKMTNLEIVMKDKEKKKKKKKKEKKEKKEKE